MLFMSSLAEALGIEHIFNMRQEDPSSPTTTEENDEVVDIVGCDVLRPRASRRAATEHYESFLIPRLLASSAGDGTADGAPASASLPAFVALVKTFLSAESGKCGEVLHLVGAFRGNGRLSRPTVAEK